MQLEYSGAYVDITSSIPRHKLRSWRKRRRLNKIVVHTTGSNNQDPHKTARYHVGPNHISSRGCPSLCYHDFITKDGTVFHCNDYSDVTWHTKGWNTSAVGVTMAFKGQNGIFPAPLQWVTLLEHITYLCLKLHVLPKNVRGHREGPGMIRSIGRKGSVRYKKTCPGMAIDLKRLRNEVTIKVQRALLEMGLYKGQVDGAFGRKSKAALKKVSL